MVITLPEQISNEELAWLLWMDLWGWLKSECEAPMFGFRPGPSESWHFERPSRTEAAVVYARDSRSYWLRMRFVPDCFQVYYAADGYPARHELRIKVQDEESWFETSAGAALTAAQAASCALATLPFCRGSA